jgi:NTE family protein
MMSNVPSSRERALVLGGGGQVGISWELGLITGLRAAGVDLADANFVLGTSAGSNAGGLLTMGVDLVTSWESLVTRWKAPSRADVRAEMGTRLDAMIQVMIGDAASARSPEESRIVLGRFALEATTMPETTFLKAFATFRDQPWPSTYACTTIDATTGAFTVWTESSGVPLDLAIASSSAVPGVYPPVSILGARYIDGGMRSATNADVATGYERVLLVSVIPPSLVPIVEQERISLTEGGARVEVIYPSDEMVEVSGRGAFLMDTTRCAAGFEAGMKQGVTEADRVGAFWS